MFSYGTGAKRTKFVDTQKNRIKGLDGMVEIEGYAFGLYCRIFQRSCFGSLMRIEEASGWVESYY